MKAKNKKNIRLLWKVLFIAYIIFLFYFLLLSDWYGRSGEMYDYHYNLVLFKEIKRFWLYREKLGMYAVFTNIGGNILIFVPFGFILPMAKKYHSFFNTVFCTLGFSFFVESFQLITKVGCFDVDDLLLNTIGGILGYIIFVICNTVRRRRSARRKR